MTEEILIIVRGISGSGKSTFAKFLATPDFICTADDYLMENGKYVWSPEKLGIAHKKCQSKCENLMRLRFPRVVIANTSTTERELRPYYDLAKKYNYKVFSVIVENRHGGKDEHNVPEETIQKMLERFSIKLI
jgi:predicted kinase